MVPAGLFHNCLFWLSGNIYWPFGHSQSVTSGIAWKTGSWKHSFRNSCSCLFDSEQKEMGVWVFSNRINDFYSSDCGLWLALVHNEHSAVQKRTKVLFIPPRGRDFIQPYSINEQNELLIKKVIWREKASLCTDFEHIIIVLITLRDIIICYSFCSAWKWNLLNNFVVIFIVR